MHHTMVTVYLLFFTWIWCLWSASCLSLSNPSFHTSQCVEMPPTSRVYPTSSRRHRSLHLLMAASDNGRQPEALISEAEDLLARAKKIRESIAEEESKAEQPENAERSNVAPVSEKTAAADGNDANSLPSVGYRLYVDIGREDGTWMDPRWGASGRRIEFTVDVDFLTSDGGESSVADEEVSARMVKDNFGGKSSPIYVMNSSPNARLRGGFDKMGVSGGAYRIDYGQGGRATVRFHLLVDGTPESGSSYGDIWIPKGCLYFSIPCFANNVKNLSSKESPVTVRQIGWHTGWRREESRIVGTFRAVPIDDAKRKDGY